jgi:hypothetical protein
MSLIRPLSFSALIAAASLMPIGCGDDEKPDKPVTVTDTVTKTVTTNTEAEPAKIDDARTVARDHVHEQGQEVKGDINAIRSQRDPDWALISGFTDQDEPWAVWLRDKDGEWQVEHYARPVTDKNPAKDAPCDIYYAFSESTC